MPWVDVAAQRRAVREQIGCRVEPLAALTQRGELGVPHALPVSIAAFEREKLLVHDGGQSLSWTPRRADLHTVMPAEVVHDVDRRRGKLGVWHIAMPPSAHAASQPGVIALAGQRPAQHARMR